MMDKSVRADCVVQITDQRRKKPRKENEKGAGTQTSDGVARSYHQTVPICVKVSAVL